MKNPEAFNMLYKLPCFLCKHYNWDNTCKAFPQGIPSEIRDYYPEIGDTKPFPHRQPYPGDNGIQYEPIKEEK